MATTKTKDLATKRTTTVKGSVKRTKDLAPKKASAVTGGGIRMTNDNMTLVRQAKPAVKKDLSPSKNPKGGVKKR